MGDVPRVGDLEVDQDLRFERREWKVQRAAWVVMLVVAVAAVLGLLGPGPLTRLTAGAEGGPLWVEYYRFERSEGPTDIKVNLGPGAVGGGNEARVWVSRRYLEAVALEKVVPKPERVEAGPDRLTYVFRLGDPSRATAVRFHFRPEQFGGQQVSIGLEGVGVVSFRQFVYP